MSTLPPIHQRGGRHPALRGRRQACRSDEIRRWRLEGDDSPSSAREVSVIQQKPFRRMHLESLSA